GFLLAFIAFALLAFPAVFLAGFAAASLGLSPVTLSMLALAYASAYLLLLFGIVVMSCLWTYRAWRNLHDLGLTGLRYSPGWAVGSYFVPLVNLYVPFKAMRELYNRSAGDDEFQADSSAELVTSWWACAVGAFAVQLFQNGVDLFNTNGVVFIVAPPTVDLAMSLLGIILSLAATFLYWKLVGRITREQLEMKSASQAFA
ncbi:MAG TPA: DUF4328 domain-containing protein, partial [Sphingomonadaceae bacterium]|nr:DUF4328 domain-containing protein [Sphingomonadaceae bacterium]